MATDWRYPFNPGLNQQATLPSGFGPPNIASQAQGAISSLADPILAQILKQRELESGKAITEKLAALGESYKTTAPGATTGSTTAAPPVSPAPGVAAANTGSPAGDDNTSTMGGGKSSVSNPEVRDKFISEVRATGLTNPYALAAVAATGQRESGWSIGNVNRTWADGQYSSGGALSWNGPRLRAMQEFTSGAEDPVAAQAAFFMKENPKLIAALNASTSSEEANKLMADAWRYKGYDRDSPEFRARENLTRLYASKFAQAPTPQAAPTASFAPTVAPAPTPAAAAAVTAPTGPAGPSPTLPGGIPAGGIPFQQPQGPARTMPAAGQSSMQSAPQEQTQQSEAEQKQQQVIQNVGQGTQQLQQRLEGQRQEGERTRVASISPELPGLGLGSTMPGAPSQPPPQPPAQPPASEANLPPPRLVPTTREPPMVAPAPAAPPAAAGPPPPQGPAAAPPARVAQGGPTALPPVVADQQQERQRRPITGAEAHELLKLATTPEQVAAIGEYIRLSREPMKQSAERFQIIHDANGNWVRLDRLTGQVSPAPGASGSQKGRDTVEVEGPGGVKRRMQWNPATEAYDIPVSAGPAPAGPVPPTKEQFEQEHKLRKDFESDPEARRYNVAVNSYQQMRSSANSGNAVGDISLIYQYMKMLDPDTGVREGEYANASQTGGLPDRITNTYNRLVTGERLNDRQRKDFVDEAGRLLQVRNNTISRTAEKVRNNAKAYGLEPDRVAKIDEYKWEPWSTPIDPTTGRPRNDPGGKDEAHAATALGTQVNPIPLPADRDAAAKTLRSMEKGKWFSITKPDGSTVVDQKR
jgi:hypothetical protein